MVPETPLVGSVVMELPHGEAAIVDLQKLAGYCLNASHPRGKHKAGVFQAVLGLHVSDADFLRNELLRAARDAEAFQSGSDEYGKRYIVDFPVCFPEGQGTVRSSWILLRGEETPRRTRCFLL